DSLHESGKVMRLRRLPGVTGARVPGGLREVFEGARQVEVMVKRQARDRAQHGEVWVVALLGFEEVAERFVVPAIQVSGLGALAVTARLALKLFEANFAQAVGERRRAHLGLPHRVAEQRV